MRFAVAHVINSPGGAVKTARLVVADVPDKTTKDDVLGALMRAGYGGRFSEAGIPFGNHDVVAEARGAWPKGLAGVDSAEAVAWAKLTAEPKRYDGRRLTLRVTDAEHARLSLAATRAGLSLQEWAVGALLAAEDHSLAMTS